MEANSANQVNESEEEYVLLDLDSVYGQLDIPPNAPYVLSVSSFMKFFECLCFVSQILDKRLKI